MADLKNAKQMVFMWCKDGLHDQCRKQYGGDRIVCSCDCNPDEHGRNYKPISKAMTEEEVKASIASLNQIMVGDAGDGVSKNRAVKASSSVWGDQVKEGNKSSSGSTMTYYNDSNYKYVAKEDPDASTIAELENRRLTRQRYYYEGGFDSYL